MREHRVRRLVPQRPADVFESREEAYAEAFVGTGALRPSASGTRRWIVEELRRGRSKHERSGSGVMHILQSAATLRTNRRLVEYWSNVTYGQRVGGPPWTPARRFHVDAPSVTRVNRANFHAGSAM